MTEPGLELQSGHVREPRQRGAQPLDGRLGRIFLCQNEQLEEELEHAWTRTTRIRFPLLIKGSLNGQKKCLAEKIEDKFKEIGCLS